MDGINGLERQRQARTVPEIRAWLESGMLKGAVGVMTPAADLEMLLALADVAQAAMERIAELHESLACAMQGIRAEHGGQPSLTIADVLAYCQERLEFEQQEELRHLDEATRAMSGPARDKAAWGSHMLAANKARDRRIVTEDELAKDAPGSPIL